MPSSSNWANWRARAPIAVAVSVILSISVFPVHAAIEEVVVTAQRTEESIQEVPIAVTAFTGAMLEEKQIITPSDLQMQAPNVSFTATNFGGSNFSIRGIGNLVIGASEGGVSIHQDEIALGTNLVAAEFYDMERVEILRGPQGTLYGRQATGGVINLVTAKPDLSGVYGHIDAEVGDYEHFRIKGALNLPVTDTFALRFAGMQLERDGYIKNTAYRQVGNLRDGGTGTLSGIDDTVDGRELYTFRISALWAPTERLSGWVQYSKFREDDDRARIKNQICKRNDIPTVGCEPDGFGFDQPHLGATTGGIFSGLLGASQLGDTTGNRGFLAPSTGFRKMHTDMDPVYFYDEDTWLANVSYDFDDFTVSIQGGYQESQFFSQQDYLMDVGAYLNPTTANPTGYWPTSDTSGRYGAGWQDRRCNFNDGTAGIFGGCIHPSDTSRVFAYDQADGRFENWTGDVRVSSNLDGAINFMAGVSLGDYKSDSGNYYVNANTLDMVGLYGVPGLNFPPLYPTMFDATGDPDGSGRLESTSYFGELYFRLSDTVKITAGLRYNDDRRETSSTSVLYNSLNACAVGLAGLIADCANGPVWHRTALASWYTTIFTGGAVAPAAGALALTDLYGVTADLNAAAAAFNIPGALTLLADVPPVPGFNETRNLTGSPSKVDFQETTGRIGVDWQWSDNSMAYVFFTRGYKPGGFNPPIPPEFQSTSSFSFASEKVDSFEIGSKNLLLNNTLVLNASAFYYDYSGLQVSRIVNNSSLNDNIDAEIYGLELEGLWRPEQMPRLTVDFSYAYLKAEATGGAMSVDPLDRTGGDPAFITLKNIDPGAFTAQSFVARRDQITQAHIDQAYSVCRALSHQNTTPGCPNVAPGTTYADGLPAYFSKQYLDGGAGNTIGVVETNTGFETSIDGNSLPSSPEHQVKLGFAYDFELPMGILTPRIDYYWQGKMYGREFNTRGDEIKAWDQVNASLGFMAADGRWQANLWVRNLMNDDNITGHYLTSDTSGFFRNYFLTEPRIWGASVRWNFGADN